MNYKNTPNKYITRKELSEQIERCWLYVGFTENIVDLIDHDELHEFNEEQILKIIKDINQQTVGNLVHFILTYRSIKGKQSQLDPNESPLPVAHEFLDNSDKATDTRHSILIEVLKYTAYKSFLKAIVEKVGIWCFASNRGRFNRKRDKKITMLVKRGIRLKNMPYAEITQHQFFIDMMTVIGL